MSDRDIVHVASAMKKRSVDSVRRGSSPPPCKKLKKGVMTSPVASYHLDDLVLETIKCHLPPMEGVFFEPLSGRFASITVKRRLSMRASIAGHSQREFQLIIQDKNVRKMAIQTLAVDIGNLLMTIVSRIYKFKTITIRSDTSDNEDIACAELLLKSLLAAAVEWELTDVHQFELICGQDQSCFSIASVSSWIDQISSSLRSLRICRWYYALHTEERQQHAAMLTAIGHCDRLRSVDLIAVHTVSNRMWSGLVDAICARPKLHSFRVHDDDDVPLTLPPMSQHTFATDRDYLTYWMRDTADSPSLMEFLARIDSFNFSLWSTSNFPWLVDDNVANVESVISSLRSSPTAPPNIAVRMQPPYPVHLGWEPETLNNWLQLASRHRTLIKIFCPTQLALPTVQQFAAIKEAIETANIPGLMMPLPVYDPQKITVTFLNGAEVQLLLE